MAKASDNEFPKLLLVPGSAPVVPAGSVGVFIDATDGHLKRVDDAATVTDTEAVGGSSGSVIPARKVTKTGGNYTINNTTWTALDATMDLTMPVAAGDVVEVGLSAYVVPNSSAQYAALDAVTVVGGSAVTSFSNGTASPAGSGVAAWMITGPSNDHGVGGSVMLTLTSGDVSGGNVTVRLRYRTNNAVNHTIRANAGEPLQFWAKNLGH